MIPQDFIDRLLSDINIVNVIKQHIPLVKKGLNHWACCPFHHEKTPSFSVNESKQFYYCFGCGETGNVISFEMKHTHKSFPETIESLAQFAGIPMPEQSQQDRTQADAQKRQLELLTNVSQRYQQQLKSAPVAINYLKQRGLTGQIAKHYHIGFAPDSWNFISQSANKIQEADLIKLGISIKHESGRVYDRFRNRVMFPVRDHRSRVVAFGGRVLDNSEPKYLNSPESNIFHKKQVIYGLFEAIEANRNQMPEVMVVEGYMDVIGLAQFGYTRAVACMGTAISGQHINLLKRYTNKLLFCFDGDKAGRQAAFRTLETLIHLIDPELECRFIFLGEGEDPDTFIRKNGKEALRELIKNAHSFEDTLIKYLSDNYANNTVQERSRLIDRARTILTQMNHPAMIHLLIERISLLCNLPSEQLRSMLSDQGENTLQKQHKINMPKDLWVKAIGYLLHCPKVANELKNIEWLKISKRKEAAHLHELISIAQSLSVNHTQQLIEKIKNEKFSKVYLRILSWDPMLSEKQIEIEFLNCFQQLEGAVTQERINDLLELSRTKGLSNDEKTELSRCIQARKQHKSTLSHEI